MLSGRSVLIDHLRHCLAVGVPKGLMKKALVQASEVLGFQPGGVAFSRLMDKRLTGIRKQFRDLRGLNHQSRIDWSPRLVAQDIRGIAHRDIRKPSDKTLAVMIILLDCLLEDDITALVANCKIIDTWLPEITCTRANCLALNEPFWPFVVGDLKGSPNFVRMHETEHQIELVANELLDKGKWSEAERVLRPLVGEVEE